MQELRKRNDTSKHMCAELGLGINAVREITKTQKGLVSATLYAIADYLDVSADYLLGRTDNAESHKL